MNISAQDVSKLRKITNAGFMDCKKALNEAEGDIDKAIEILRKKGKKISQKRADRQTQEGFVVAKTKQEDHDTERSVIFAVTCETDFVAKNEIFKKLTDDLSNAAIEHNSETIEGLLNSTINGQSVNDVIIDTIGKIGEKIEIKNLHTSTSSICTVYIHPGDQLGVLLCIDTPEKRTPELREAAYNIAMQIAAMNPLALSEEHIEKSILDKEMEIGLEQAKKEKKPENVTQKIAEGKVKKFIKENTLLNQQYIKDNSMSVASYLKTIDANAKIKTFYRVSIK